MAEPERQQSDRPTAGPAAPERRGQRERTGIVVSDRMNKTVVVRVEQVFRHPKYKKVIRRSRTFYAHDEASDARPGDTVRIRETRPLSKLKRWRVIEVVKSGRQPERGSVADE